MQTNRLGFWIYRKIEVNSTKLPSIINNELLDCFICGINTIIQKETLKKDPETFEKVYLFAERCSYLFNFTAITILKISVQGLCKLKLKKKLYLYAFQLIESQET